MNTKKRWFNILASDIAWLHQIRQEALQETIGNVNLSEILADIIKFAKKHSYKYSK